MTTTFSIPSVETDRLFLRAHADDLPRMTAFFETERSHMVGGPKDEIGSSICWSAVSATGLCVATACGT